MMWALRWLLAASLALLPLSESFAAAGLTTVSVLDSGGTARTFTVNSTTGAVTGGLSATQTICDLTTPTQCIAVDSSGLLTIKIASGGVASGAVASGAFASGAIAAGAQVDLLTMRGTVNAGTAAANSLLAGGVYNSTPLTLTNTQQASLQVDANGYLKVNTAAGAAAGGTSSNFGSGFPTPGTAIGFSDGTNMVAAKVGAIVNVSAATNMINALGAAQYNATPLTVTDTRYQSLQSDVNGFLKVNVANANANGQATMANSSPVVLASNQASIPVAATLGAETTKNIGTTSQLPYPSGAVPYTATATGTTGATTATLAGASSVTTYLCGFSIRANATAAATGNATVTGVITATLNFTQWTAPNASGLGITEMIFSPCVPASTTNQSVAIVSAAPGTGGVVSVTAWGYKL